MVIKNTVLTILVMFALISSTAAAIPGIPNPIYGFVTINGNSAADGTSVTAQIDGETVASTTTSNGEYLLEVNDPDSNRAGDTINFFVNLIDTAQISTFCNGCVTEVNLTVGSPQEVWDNPPIIHSLNYPPNNSYLNSPTTWFNATASDDINLIAMELNIWNSTGDTVNQTNITFTNGTESGVQAILTDGTYTWNYKAYDNSSQTAWFSSDYTITINTSIDTTKPVISNISSSITSSSSTITWDTDELSNSTVYYGKTVNTTLNKTDNSSVMSHSMSLASLSASTLYYYNVSSCDASGNCNTSTQYNFTTSAPPTSPSPSPSGGGGGGDGGYTPHIAEENESLNESVNVTKASAPTSTTGQENVCVVDWECSNWDRCSEDSIQTRECIDINNCDIELSRPFESQPCIEKQSDGSIISRVLSGIGDTLRTAFPSSSMTGKAFNAASSPAGVAIAVILLFTGAYFIKKKKAS